MLTACIAEIGILIANLDSVAPIITMWVFHFIPSSIRYFEVAWGTGSRWLSECIVGLFWGSNLPSCWKCVLQNSLTMHFDNHFDPASCAQHGCESALWDCFGGRICRHVENASPKTVPQCTLTTSNPVSRATSNQPRFLRRMECRKPPPLHKIWTSQIDSERHI